MMILRSALRSSVCLLARKEMGNKIPLYAFTHPPHSRMALFSTLQQAPENSNSGGFMAKLRQRRSGEVKDKEALEAEERVTQAELITSLSTKEKFTLADLREYYAKQLEKLKANIGWKSYIPGFEQQSVKQLEATMKLFDHFTPEEMAYKKDVKKKFMTRDRLLELQAKAGLDVKSLDQFFAQHRQFLSINTWARKRVLQGKYVPKTFVALAHLMDDPDGAPPRRKPAGFKEAYGVKRKR